MKLTPEHIAKYRVDGATVVRGLFNATEMKLLETGIERNMEKPSPLAIVASKPEDPGYFIEDFCNWQRIPEFKQFIFELPAAEIAGQLMGGNEVRLYHDHLLVKEPKTVATTCCGIRISPITTLTVS